MLDVRLKKIRSDLFERKGRTLLTLMGLCIGLWGVATMAVAWLVLSNDLSENFASTNPPGIDMELVGEGRFDTNKLGPLEGIGRVENRPVFMGRAEVTPGTVLPMIIWMVEDFNKMKVATFKTTGGATTPPIGTLLIEKNALLLSNYFLRTRGKAPVQQNSNGEIVATPKFEDLPFKIGFSDGLNVVAKVSGTIHNPGLPPATQERILTGWVTPETAKLWFGDTIKNRLIVQSADGYGSDVSIRETSKRIQARVQELGFDIGSIKYPSETEHLHQFQMNSALFLLSGVGLLALLMSIVLVLNLINAILTSQVRQIGILKAIGASSSKVAVTYITTMALIGLAAALIAIPFAKDTGYGIANWIARFLNFEILTTELPVVFVMGLYALGIAFPILAAWSSIIRWVNVSVTDALQHNGVNPEDEMGVMADKLPLPLSLTVRMGIRNAFRKRQRLILTAATLGLGILVFMVSLNIRSSLLFTADSEVAATRFDVTTYLKAPTERAKTNFLASLDQAKAAEAWRVRPAIITQNNGIVAEATALYIMPEGSEAMRPMILDGVWLTDDSSGGVVVNYRQQKDNPDLVVGAMMNVNILGQDQRLKVVGISKEFFGAAIYIKDADYRRLYPDDNELVNIAFVTLAERNEPNLAKLMADIEVQSKVNGLDILSIMSSKRASRIIYAHLDGIIDALLLLAALMLFVGVLGMASGISTSVVERTREIGILRAIGGKPSAIRSILSAESIVMATLGWFMALIVAQPISRVLADYFGTVLVEYPFAYEGSLMGVAISLAGAIVLALLSTIVPAFLANRQPVKEAIAYE